MRDVFSTLAWSVLAAGIVYIVMLSPARREKVVNAACEMLDQLRLLALDIQGYEPEM
jgi:hypothetical protein